MASLNKVMLIGNLGRDPETRTFPSGDSVTNVSIATTETWKDRQSGEQREATEWHNLVFNGRLAEIAAQYLRKGSQVYIEGRIRTRKWQDKNGQDRYTTEIRVEEMKMLGSRGDGQRRDNSGGGNRYDNSSAQYDQSGGDHGGYAQSAPAPRPAAPAPAPQAPASNGFDDFSDDVPF